MVQLWYVRYKTFPETGKRKDEEEYFFANGYRDADGQVTFGRTNSYSKSDLVRWNRVIDGFSENVPERKIENYPNAPW